MTPIELITQFYTAFANGDSVKMAECYHEDIVFQDPAFGRLEGTKAGKMWEMLLSNKKANLSIHFEGIEASEEQGKANWIANYQFGPKKRKVTNSVTATFTFKEGKIIEHIDSFNLWKWTQQAMGLPGYMLGWSSFMKNKIQRTTNMRLDAFIKEK